MRNILNEFLLFKLRNNSHSIGKSVHIYLFPIKKWKTILIQFLKGPIEKKERNNITLIIFIIPKKEWNKIIFEKNEYGFTRENKKLLMSCLTSETWITLILLYPRGQCIRHQPVYNPRWTTFGQILVNVSNIKTKTKWSFF